MYKRILSKKIISLAQDYAFCENSRKNVFSSGMDTEYTDTVYLIMDTEYTDTV